MTSADVMAVIGMIAGLAGSTDVLNVGTAIDSIAPGWGHKTVAVISIAAFGCGLVMRTRTANTNTAIAATTTKGLPPHG